MHGFSEMKPKKLIRINIEFNKTIENIDISGDFYVHPEESLKLIEKKLTGIEISKLNTISHTLIHYFKENNIQLNGISADDIQKAIIEATKATEKAFEPHLKKINEATKATEKAFEPHLKKINEATK